MNAKQKESRSKKNWRAIRRRYTWHLRAPFKSRLDRSHWWERRSKVEPVAALYELARRHPLVWETWLSNFAAAAHNRRGVAVWVQGISEEWINKITRRRGDNSLPPSLAWTCLLGLRSWANLTYTERINWKSCVGKLKGLDFRDESSQCQSIKLLAHGEIIDQRKDALSDKGQTFEELRSVARMDIAENPITTDEWEAAIAYRAVEAHRRGDVLLAFAPDLTVNKAAEAAAAKYKEHLCLNPAANTAQRARWQDWLTLISEFEDAETSTHKAYSQLFARYRRAVDGICFK